MDKEKAFDFAARRIAAAMIKQAILDIERYLDYIENGGNNEATENKYYNDAISAVAWVKSIDRKCAFNIGNCCEMANVNMQLIRKKIIKKAEKLQVLT